MPYDPSMYDDGLGAITLPPEATEAKPNFKLIIAAVLSATALIGFILGLAIGRTGNHHHDI